ncbi:MAG: hypothetical protein KAV87_10620 [Desulfobacteraceae bacterium]|nr:hypothetical protein [Desulfobacteraceae bacterium]
MSTTLVITHNCGVTYTKGFELDEDAERYEEVFLWGNEDIDSWQSHDGVVPCPAPTDDSVPF